MSSAGHVGHSSQAGACDFMVRSFWGRGWMAGRGRPLAHIAPSVLRSGRRFIEDHDLKGTGLRHRGAPSRYKVGFAARLLRVASECAQVGNCVTGQSAKLAKRSSVLHACQRLVAPECLDQARD
jgi:hypothetical protein